MLTPEQLWLVVAPVDMRLGIDGLSAHLQHRLGQAPCDGKAYVFHNCSGNRLKVVLWDGTGVWLCQRRLHRGAFRWPRPGEDFFAITAAQWQWLIAGVDWQRLQAKPDPAWQV